jgi:hypothetical protein
MRFGPGEGCLECPEIARQFNEGFAEAYERSKAASEALCRLIAGTEDDAEHFVAMRRSPHGPQAKGDLIAFSRPSVAG